MFQVQDRQCSTCIYRKDSPLDITELEAEIADPHMEGFFVGYRGCHHAPDTMNICCRGFWDRHKDHFMMGQFAQRWHLVAFVHVDIF